MLSPGADVRSSTGPNLAQHTYVLVSGAGSHLIGDSDSKFGNYYVMPIIMTLAAPCVSGFALDSDSQDSARIERIYLICTLVFGNVLSWWGVFYLGCCWV